jgi:hypothetical protein
MTNFFLRFGTANVPCGDGKGFLGFPTWYHYLNSISDASAAKTCVPQITGINDIWLIVAAVIEILLRVGVLVAIGIIIYAGFQYVTSQGEPDKTTQARKTIINAVIGLVITIFAAAIVNFLAGSFSS